MSRRSTTTELEFGSDSFLDIVANLVGVLIILIVIMGIRVAQQASAQARQQRPILVTTTTSSTPEPVPPVPIELPSATHVVPSVPGGPTTDDLIARQEKNAQAEQANLKRRLAFERQQQRQAALVSELATWQDRLQELGTTDQQLQTQLSAAQTALTQTSESLQQLDQSLAEIQIKEKDLAARLNTGQDKLRELDATAQATLAKLRREGTQAQALQAEIAQLAQQQNSLREQIEQQFAAAQSHLSVLQKLGDTPPSTKKITHQMTSMGAIVVKEESHFRLQNGRISYVPVLELIGLVKEDLENNKEELMRSKSRFGNVGPINGFSLRYKASRQQVSVVDELRMGGAVFKIGVDYWELFEGGLSESEPIEIATMPNSQFVNRMNSLSPAEHNITLWVYPDSYDLYQQLRGSIEKAGFQIAARPLPAGVPIAGSPTGSRSLSQ